MRAIVGQFLLGGRAFRARPVDANGQPTWMVGQLQHLVHEADSELRQELIELLLDYDWAAIVTNIHWTRYAADLDRRKYVFVCEVGTAHSLSNAHGARRYELTDEPDSGALWAYLWDSQAESLHVYAAAHGRWHHVATFVPAVLAAANPRMSADIEVRRQWALEAAA
ncbi:hypothetical protein Ait01nite_020240 [Actinoplanes italicus]|uniref:Uncharacterized protein n=1 Tax=Actinoplanes italicus TaxID=113567 RepID=A0A2T0KPB2_9ACTN|nr:hypothetical protein [Actinoplanes italicus]PRX25577.1 hypothetical protein CLV67_101294 [Actinoplanes italicus]GIE28979.1 hypothetical protein Ait01nite_020240 [Actinoplanes italicus]